MGGVLRSNGLEKRRTNPNGLSIEVKATGSRGKAPKGVKRTKRTKVQLPSDVAVGLLVALAIHSTLDTSCIGLY